MVRNGLVDQSMLFTHLYLMQGGKKKPDLYLLQAENILVLNPQLFCLPTSSHKKSTHWKDELTAKYVFFFITEAIKIAVIFSKFQGL